VTCILVSRLDILPHSAQHTPPKNIVGINEPTDNLFVSLLYGFQLKKVHFELNQTDEITKGAFFFSEKTNPDF